MEERLGYKIRKIREIKNISQDFVAKHLNISQAAYSKLEIGKTKVDDDKLTRIAAALEVKPDIIENFNERFIFNVRLPTEGAFLVIRGETIYNINSLKKMQEVYEKLLMEKDKRIKILEQMVNK